MFSFDWRAFLALIFGAVLAISASKQQVSGAETIVDMNWQNAYWEADPESAVFGPRKCGDPCVIRYSEGGVIGAFMNFAFLIRSSGRRLVIDGRCISACAILADFARPNVCITKRATFEFHMAFDDAGRRGRPPASPDISRWVGRHGGFPYDGLLVMRHRDATRYWPTCRK